MTFLLYSTGTGRSQFSEVVRTLATWCRMRERKMNTAATTCSTQKTKSTPDERTPLRLPSSINSAASACNATDSFRQFSGKIWVVGSIEEGTQPSAERYFCPNMFGHATGSFIHPRISCTVWAAQQFTRVKTTLHNCAQFSHTEPTMDRCCLIFSRVSLATCPQSNKSGVRGAHQRCEPEHRGEDLSGVEHVVVRDELDEPRDLRDATHHTQRTYHLQTTRMQNIWRQARRKSCGDHP